MWECDRLSCWPSRCQQVLHQRWIWGIQCRHERVQARNPPWLYGVFTLTNPIPILLPILMWVSIGMYCSIIRIGHFIWIRESGRVNARSPAIQVLWYNYLVVAAKISQSHLSLLIVHWVHDLILMSTFRWLAPKKWYGKPVTNRCISGRKKDICQPKRVKSTWGSKSNLSNIKYNIW